MSDEDLFEDDEDYGNVEDDMKTPTSCEEFTESPQKKIKEGYKVIDDEGTHRTQLMEGHFSNNEPFVYHNLEEVLKYTFNCFPKNNNIYLIGMHVFNADKGHYLQKHSDARVSIALDFTIVDGVPNNNELVSVFGFLDIKKSTPVLMVQFFRTELKIFVNDYINKLLEIRKYVPNEYLATVSNDTFE